MFISYSDDIGDDYRNHILCDSEFIETFNNYDDVGNLIFNENEYWKNFYLAYSKRNLNFGKNLGIYTIWYIQNQDKVPISDFSLAREIKYQNNVGLTIIKALCDANVDEIINHRNEYLNKLLLIT